MAKIKNFQRQMWQVQNLAAYVGRDAGTVEIFEFKCEEWAGGNVCVTRKWRPLHAPSLTYSQCYRVGPLGGTKKVYDTLYY